MAVTYFILEKGILERDDLSIYEKMCCVVLAKWASEDMAGFDTITLAREMSCTVNKASETIKQLKAKGFIQMDEESAFSDQAPRIIKAEQVEGLTPLDFEETETPAPLTREMLTQGVRDIIEETINDSEARIILNFANDDLDKIRRCYKKAKNMQIGDKIEVLMMELQRKESFVSEDNHKVAPPKEPSVIEEKVINTHQHIQQEDKGQIPSQMSSPSPQEKSERPWYLDDEDIIKPPSTQINTNMIQKMKAYKKYGK